MIGKDKFMRAGCHQRSRALAAARHIHDEMIVLRLYAPRNPVRGVGVAAHRHQHEESVRPSTPPYAGINEMTILRPGYRTVVQYDVCVQRVSDGIRHLRDTVFLCHVHRPLRDAACAAIKPLYGASIAMRNRYPHIASVETATDRGFGRSGAPPRIQRRQPSRMLRSRDRRPPLAARTHLAPCHTDRREDTLQCRPLRNRRGRHAT